MDEQKLFKAQKRDDGRLQQQRKFLRVAVVVIEVTAAATAIVAYHVHRSNSFHA